MDFGREKGVFPLVLIQVKSATKRTVLGLKNKREKTFLPFKTQLFHIQIVRYALTEQAFNVMRRLRLPYSQAEEMFLRMVFNVVIRNQDDHTKNISFLMDKTGKWTLSPAYDIGFAYNPKGSWTDTHQMSINGKFDDITRQDLLACAAANNIKNAAEIIDKVCETTAKWPEMAKNCGVPQEMIDARLPYMLLNV